MVARNTLEKSILKFFKIVIVLFSLLVILESVFLRPLGFMNAFMSDKKEVISGFRQDNFMLLVGFTKKTSNNDSYSSLSYILVPKSISLPSILYIYKRTNGEIEYENGDNLQAIIGVLILLYGFYKIGSYIKSSCKHNGDLDKKRHQVSEKR